MKASKTLRAIVLVLALVVCMCLLLASCGEKPCEHTGGTATCTEKAVCSECGEAYGETVAHSYADATCTAPKTCSVCGATDGEAAGHDWADATCTAPKTCNTCGETEGEAAGHDWADATCTAPKTCNTCGETEGEALGHTYVGTTCSACEALFDYKPVTSLNDGDIVVIGAPAYGKALSMVKTGYYNVGIDYSASDFSNITVAELFVVTVNDDGSYSFTSLSGKVLAIGGFSSLDETGENTTWEVIAKDGAEGLFYVKNVGKGNYLEWYSSKDNWSSYNTSNLDGQFEMSFYKIQPHEHDLLLYSYDDETAPDCNREGFAIFKCAVCGHTEEIGGQYHRFDYCVEYTEGKEPTCTTDGHGLFECNWCFEQVTRLVPPTHSYENNMDVYVAPTCTEGGSQTFVCTDCGHSYTEDLSANGHNQKWYYDSTTATCTEAGVEIYGCYNCTATIEVEVEAYGHEWYQVGEIDLVNHVINQECNSCGTTRTVSSLGSEEDPLTLAVPGNFTLSATESWTYYSLVHPGEGYVTFTFNTTNVSIMVNDNTYTYDSQYSWGGSDTLTVEIMADGVYAVLISTSSGTEEIEVTTTYEAADVPAPGETAEKAIEMYNNTAYYANGSVWYKFDNRYTSGANITITVNGNATVTYGADPESMVAYAGTFVGDANSYYILVESTEEVEVVLKAEMPVGSLDNPQEIVEGANVVEITEGSYYLTYYTYENVTITLTYDATANPNAVIWYGNSPMMLNNYLEGTAVIELSAWSGLYVAVNAEDWGAVSVTINATIEAVVEEPEEPSEGYGEKIGTLDVEVTDTYVWEGHLSTYTATEAGNYTFFLPAGLGFWSADSFESGDWQARPEMDYYNNEAGQYVTVTLAAGEEFSFYFASITTGTYTIDVYYVA